MRRIVFAAAALALATPALTADRKVEEARTRAEGQIAKGKTDEALKTMQKLVDQNPTSAEAYEAFARVQLRVGGVEEAAASAAKAVELAGSAAPPVKAQALVTLAELDLTRGSGKDAVAHAQEAVTLASSAAALSALARAQARVQDPAALATAQKAVEAGAQDAAAHEALGQALLATQRGEEAAAAFRKALELDAKRASARAGLGAALLAQGKAAEAVAEARKASEDDPRSGEAFAVLGTALLAQNKEQWNDAIAQAQQGAFLNPRNPVVQLAVGRIFEAGGNIDQAASAYKRALEADPGFVPAQLEMLAIESRRSDVNAALARVKQILDANPQSAQAQLAYGRLLARKGDWEEAAEPLEKAAAGLPNNAEAHALLGTARQYSGESEQALEAYKKAIALAPNNIEYRTTYGLLLGINKQYAEGIAELKKVTASPGYKDAAGWVNLGWIYTHIEPEQAEEAVAAYKKGLEIDPKNAQAALGLGWAYSYAKKYDEAIAAFNKAIELDPKATTGEAYNGIGWSYFFKKDMAQAKVAVGKAKAAGRNVKLLESNIEKVEKGIQAAADEAEARAQFAQEQRSQGPDVGTLGNQLMNGGAGARRSAAAQLGRMGAPAVQYLVYAAVNDKDMGVRQAAINSLGAVGGAARSTCGQLNGIASRNPYEQTIMSKEQQEQWLRYEDLRKAARSARSRIGC